MSDFIGERGEDLFRLHLNPPQQPMFRASFLGDKWPTIDFLVQLQGDPSALFLAQVRASSTKSRDRLEIRVSKQHVRALRRFRVPTYLFGVDLVRERTYIVWLGQRTDGFRSMSRRFRLDDHRDKLYNEVRNYWRGVESLEGSFFADPEWSTS